MYDLPSNDTLFGATVASGDLILSCSAWPEKKARKTPDKLQQYATVGAKWPDSYYDGDAKFKALKGGGATVFPFAESFWILSACSLFERSWLCLTSSSLPDIAVAALPFHYQL